MPFNLTQTVSRLRNTQHIPVDRCPVALKILSPSLADQESPAAYYSTRPAVATAGRVEQYAYHHITNPRIQLVKNAPDDGPMRSETCRANISAEYTHSLKHLVYLVGLQRDTSLWDCNVDYSKGAVANATWGNVAKEM